MTATENYPRSISYQNHLQCVRHFDSSICVSHDQLTKTILAFGTAMLACIYTRLFYSPIKVETVFSYYNIISIRYGRHTVGLITHNRH
jgi:hypothetical protein